MTKFALIVIISFTGGWLANASFGAAAPVASALPKSEPMVQDVVYEYRSHADTSLTAAIDTANTRFLNQGWELREIIPPGQTTGSGWVLILRKPK